MKKILLIVLIILLVGCKKDNVKKYDNLIIGTSSNMIDKNDIDLLKEILIKNNVSNIDKFISLLEDYNLEEDMGCGLNDWVDNYKLKYDDVACIDRYEKNHKLSDGNCRLTAFMLLQNSLTTNKVKNNSGTYLMFDDDVIENNKDYDLIKKDYNKYVTIFDEIDISKLNKSEYKDAFTNKWKEYDIKNNNNKVSLITFVINDPYDKVLFIGHAGILIDLNDKYLFIEKIAFEEPYQFNILKNKEDLKDLFSKRENYFNDESEGTFIYENDKLLFSY